MPTLEKDLLNRSHKICPDNGHDIFLRTCETSKTFPRNVVGRTVTRNFFWFNAHPFLCKQFAGTTEKETTIVCVEDRRTQGCFRVACLNVPERHFYGYQAFCSPPCSTQLTHALRTYRIFQKSNICIKLIQVRTLHILCKYL